MFTRGKITAPSKGKKPVGNYLSRHLVKPDYYTKSETVTGIWVGAQAAEWRIAGNEINSKDKTYRLLNEGFTPDGNLIDFPRSRKYSFYDFQCSAQKSLSLMAVMMKDDFLIKNVHEVAALEAFQELEKFMGWMDQSNGKSAKNDENFNYTGKACAAMFTHHVGRELQSQLHTHFVVANVVYDKDGNARTLDCTQMYEAIRYAGKFYQARCAELLLKACYNVVLVRENGLVTGYEIKGVPFRVLDRSDRRRQAIEKAINIFKEKYSRSPTPSEIHDLVLKTRNEIVIPGFKKKAGMFETNTAEINAYERSLHEPEDLKEMKSLLDMALSQRGSNTRDFSSNFSIESAIPSLNFAIEHCLERKSVRSRHEVLAEAFNQSQGTSTVSHIKEALDKLERGQKVLHLDRNGADGLAGRVCSDKAFMQEQWAIDEINSTMNSCPMLVKNYTPLTRQNVETITPGKDLALSDSQNEVLRRLCSSTDRYMAIRGIAGAGKTTTLTHFHREMKRHGRVVHYCAPTTVATGKLDGDVAAAAGVVGVSAMNTMQFILQAKNLRECGKFLGSILVIDEAGLASNEQGEKILRAAKRLNMRVVFVGDEAQHKSVAAGDFFRIIQEHSNLKNTRLHLDEIFRQNPAPAYKAVCEKLADRKFKEAFDDFDSMGWIHESNEYLKNGADNWLGRHATGEESIVSAPTWEEIRGVTRHIRGGLKATGELAQEDFKCQVVDNFDWSVAQKKQIENYEIGQTITAVQTSGSFFTGRSAAITGIKGNCILLDNGLELNVLRSGMKINCGLQRDINVSIGEKILIHQNFKPGIKPRKERDLVNGEFLNVSGFDKNGDILTREGKTIPKGFLAWGHGYAATSHRVQGLSVTSSVGVGERLSGDAWYVICTRGKNSVTFFTPSKERTKEGLTNDGSRVAPSDILSEKERDDLENSLRERDARNGVRNALKDPIRQGRDKLAGMRDFLIDNTVHRSGQELITERLRDKVLIRSQRQYESICDGRGVETDPQKMQIPKQGRGVRTPEVVKEIARRHTETQKGNNRERAQGFAV